MMTIKHCKFYKDGVQVPIEHGNKEQIELLNRIQNLVYRGELLKGYEKNHLDEFNSILCFNHICICGGKTPLEYTYKEVSHFDMDKLK